MGCPEPETWLSLARGALSGAERDTVLAHVDGCEECRRLMALAAKDDAGAGPTDPAIADTVTDTPAGERRALVLARGEQVGRYRIDALLGSGGLGIVYSADDPELGRKVALKLLKVDARADGPGGQERLLREARALARISHPNVVAVHDVGQWRDRVFLAMELIDGQDLRGWLAERPRRPRAIVDLFLAAGRGLAAAHAAGLVHRDFKPENLLVGRDGRVCVTDFGLARAAGQAEAPATAPADDEPPDVLESPLTRAGAILGTPAYMAPEQHEGGFADARSDQFAFCASLYEALCGQRPFEGKTYADLRAAVLAGRVRPPPPDAEAGVLALIRRGLATRPADRWPSMDALVLALGRDRTRIPRRLAALAVAALAVIGTAAAADW